MRSAESRLAVGVAASVRVVWLDDVIAVAGVNGSESVDFAALASLSLLPLSLLLPSSV